MSAEWIKLTDKLPDEHTDVLLWDQEYGHMIGWRREEPEVLFQAYGDNIPRDVTHWQPLPPPPKD